MRETLFLIILWISHFASAQTPGEWTWMSGDSTVNSTGVFGIQGTPEINNKPPGLYQSCGVTDLDGNFWLFGGANFENDGDALTFNSLWKFSASTLEWTWMKGSSSAIKFGVYGIKEVAGINNTPGSRYGASMWIDSLNNLWLFGGIGFASTTADLGYGYLNDLWKYEIASNQWIWMHGSDDATAGLNIPQYGQMGMPNSSNTPNGRWQCNNWTDKQGILWLFGGYNNENSLTGYYNDLWRYNPSTNEWTWIKGDSLPGQLGSFGTLGIANITNNPSARTCQAHWIDIDGDLWMFGGYKLIYISGYFYVASDDLWEYLIDENSWICWRSSFPGDIQTSEGIECIPDTLNYPTMRAQTAMAWNGNEGNFWIFGGYTTVSFFDLWKYFPDKNIWVREFGLADNTNGHFGEKMISSPLNIPPSRYGGVSWQDSEGRFWLFGGTPKNYTSSQSDCYNDLWRYLPDTACGVFTSTEEIQNSKQIYEIYPNPATNIITLISPSLETSQLIFRNGIGTIVLSKSISGNDVVDTSNLPIGMYYISIYNGDGLATHKLIISR